MQGPATDLIQRGILAPVPAQARYLTFQLAPQCNRKLARQSLAALQTHIDGKHSVLGLGAGLCKALALPCPTALKPFSAPKGSQIKLAATHGDLWFWLRATPSQDRGALLARTRSLQALLGDAFVMVDAVDAFKHHTGRDLTGYEDGTENPKGKKALAAGFAADGSSFVAVQKWQHQWLAIQAMTETQRNHAIGRQRRTNQELAHAPASAHIKRTTQEDFTLRDGSQGFSLRRSMPWSDATDSGLLFAAFGKSFEAFELQLARMVGADDGLTDALFNLSKPVTGSYFWCPPVDNGQIKIL
jgi:porphyrinogen peroxidase